MFLQTAPASEAVKNVGTQLTDQATETTGAVMTSFTNAMTEIFIMAPKALAAVVVMVIGYIAARMVAKAITAVSEKVGLQRAAESGGLVESMKQVGIERTVPQIVGAIFFWLLMCVFLLAAFDILELTAVTGAIEKVTAYIPKLLVATFVVVLGLLLAAFLKGIVATSADRVGISYAQQLASACYWILALMTFIAAFDQLEIQFKLLNEAMLIAFAGVAMAFGLSVGLGGRDVMAGILSGYYVRQRLQTGDKVTIGEFEGSVREVGPVATIVETEEDGMVHRHSIPNTKMLNEAVR